MYRLIHNLIVNFNSFLKTYMPLLAFVILGTLFTSCNKNSDVVAPVAQADNLVIVSDNNQSDYLMLKVLGKIRSTFPDIKITYFKSKQFDIYQGSFLLSEALKSFPSGTVIAGIVEPGAGGKRFVFDTGNKRVFAPDNGMATWILHDNPNSTCYYVENSSVLNGANAGDLSFEDFYADAICSLISGKQASTFGTKVSAPVTFAVQEPTVNGNTILGQILYTDDFGNCISNIPESLVTGIPLSTALTFSSDTTKSVIKMGSYYSSVNTGENVCFVNGSKLLELAINMGDFSEKFNITAGSIIKITK